MNRPQKAGKPHKEKKKKIRKNKDNIETLK